MKKLYLFMLTGLMAVIVSSCGGGTTNVVEYLPIKVDEDEKWGLINAKGEMLVSDEFSEHPTCVINGYFNVEESGGIAVYKADKKIHIVGDLENLKDAGIMSEGRMPVVSKGERIRYVNEDGETMFTLDPVGGKEIVSVSSYFSEGLALVKNSEGDWGFINKDGEVVIPINFSGVQPFKDGYAIVSKTKDEKTTYYVIDKKGEEVLKIKKDYEMRSGFVIDGTVLVENDDRISLIDVKSGEYTKLPTKVKGITFYNDKYMIFKENGNLGVMGRDMETIIRAKYDELEYNGNGQFIAKTESGKWKVINTDDEELFSLDEDGDYANLSVTLQYYTNFSSDFEIINARRGNVTIADASGKGINKDTYYNIGLYFNTIVNSDYFDAEGAITKLVSYIKGTTVGNVTLGASPRSFLDGSAESHRSEDTYTIPNLEGGYRYSIEGKAKDINTYFVTSESVPDGYWYRTVYQYNPQSTVDEIRLTLSTGPNETYEKLASNFKNKIASKGWTLEKDGKAYQVYRSGQAYLLVTPHGSYGDGVNLYMYPADYWQQKKDYLINEAVSNYNNFAKNTATNDYTTEAVVAEVDSVAADSVYVDMDW